MKPTASGAVYVIAMADVSAPIASYVTRSGDSLWKIAQANGTSIQALREANPTAERHIRRDHKPDQLVLDVGVEIKFRKATEAAPATTAGALPEANRTRGVSASRGARVAAKPVQPVSARTDARIALAGKSGPEIEAAAGRMSQADFTRALQPTTRSHGRSNISAERRADYERIGHLIRGRYPNPTKNNPPPFAVYDSLLRMAHEDSGVPLTKLRSVMRNESSGVWNAIPDLSNYSRQYATDPARGLMQMKNIAWTDVRQNHSTLSAVDYRSGVENPGLNTLMGALYYRMRGGSEGYYSGTAAQNRAYSNRINGVRHHPRRHHARAVQL